MLHFESFIDHQTPPLQINNGKVIDFFESCVIFALLYSLLNNHDFFLHSAESLTSQSVSRDVPALPANVSLVSVPQPALFTAPVVLLIHADIILYAARLRIFMSASVVIWPVRCNVRAINL